MSSDQHADTFADFRGLEFMHNRIPALPALRGFVAQGDEQTPEITDAIKDTSSRWYPVEGGHNVLIRHRGGTYDTTRFSVDPTAWDHEHCDRCNGHIHAMTLCWCTKTGPVVLLCVACKEEMDENSAS